MDQPERPMRLVPRGGSRKSVALGKDEVRTMAYDMAPWKWKMRCQMRATPEQQASFAASQKTHSSRQARRCAPDAAALYDRVSEGSSRPS